MAGNPSRSAPAARVVLLAGPSGCGKTYLARASGLPTIALDDFYRDGSSDGLPTRDDGSVDWEDAASWDGDAALAALRALCHGDEVEVPTYAFGQDRAVGRRTVRRDGASIVVAEGLFAAELVGPLTDAGLLADAILIDQRARTTFVHRLARDLRERRKPPAEVLRAGRAKRAAEPELRRRLVDLGCRPVAKRWAGNYLALLAVAQDGSTSVGPAGIEPATEGL